MSLNVLETDWVLYLVRRKYRGFPYDEDIFEEDEYFPAATQQKVRGMKERADAYYKELALKPLEEVAKLYKEEKEREHQEHLDQYIAEEKQRFFNRPDAQTDYNHWSKTPYWKLEEAVALSFDRDPHIVSWDKLCAAEYDPPPPFIERYRKVRDLTFRAYDSGHLSNPTAPRFYIAWAKRHDIPFPEALEAQVILYAGNIGDWKTAHDNIQQLQTKTQQEYEEYIAETQRIINEKDALLIAANNMRDAALKISEELQLKFEEQALQNEKPLKTRERDTLLKLIIGMAVKGYRYNPGASRNSAIAEIEDDLMILGIPVTDDTIRTWLGKAGELLPQDAEVA
ncbi:MAG TPA: hypothetical protein VFT64_11235 [Rickettsiales bacterium]|nr:hypothetical protein [Rickettsiales bacterium]